MAQRQPSWQQVAETFLGFFKERGHTVVPGSSLVPANDPTLLFTNAGMVQFKDAFLGRERPAYPRAATLQKCMRVQGKHNDLENVGPSPWHHTFFLMLGNFSFGDYFKREAIAYAADLMLRVYGVDPQRLVATVFETDDEAYDAWRTMDFPTARILRMGEATNFWMMAETGPCGPTSELHYDWGPQACTCGRPDCSVALDNGCLRWLEVWNLVFMQFDQQPDGARVPLPSPGVDTGMGLERMTSVLQGVHDDYGTDLFLPLMDRIQQILGGDPAHRRAHELAYRVMADHGRAMAFLLADGVVPGNEGRGYVLRMIMRRAMRFARSAGTDRPFLPDLAAAVVEVMGGVYPELHTHRRFLEDAARHEEARFTQTLTTGLQRLEDVVAEGQRRGERVLSGEDVFRLYDTYGFPVEMTRDVARERNLTIDEAGFARAMEEQRERARAAHQFKVAPTGVPSAEAFGHPGLAKIPPTQFVGDRKLAVRARVLAFLENGSPVDEVRAGAEVHLVLDRTPFYAEGGGQVGDTGTITTSTGTVEVRDTRRGPGELILHLGIVHEGVIRLGQSGRAAIDAARRHDIMRNHTATHLLHKALRETLGEHARQAGSLVAPDRLRFDFVHLAPLTSQQREAIEARVNGKVLEDLPVRARWLTYEDAVASGAMALFGEKYGDRVRMVSIDEFSRELCGGTHLARTGQIGLFKITSEGGVAAGVRRIEAVTGRGALAQITRQDELIRSLAEQLSAGPDELLDRVRRLAEQVKALERQLKQGAARADAREQVRAAVEHAAVDVAGVRVVVVDLGVDHVQTLRALADYGRDLLEQSRTPGVVVLASGVSGQLVATRTRREGLAPAVHVGEFLRALALEFGGSGGGREEFAQGGLKDPSRVRDLVERARDPDFLRAKVARPP